MGNYSELMELEKLVYSCRKCPELNVKEPYTALFGQGNPDAKIMFVAQSPCELCVIKQKVFYKGSGAVLDMVLENIGEDRSTVYITNVCKCHTPNNRVNTKEEIENCRPFLDKEIEIVKPKIIVPLGKQAFDWFGCSAWLKREKRDGYDLYPVSHPARIARRPDLLVDYLRGFDWLKEVIEK